MPRLEIFTGTERRRRWPDAEKLAVLEEASVPGISAASVARRHDILPQQIYRWRRQFGFGRDRVDNAGRSSATVTPVSFLPLELVASGNGGTEQTVRPNPAPVSSSPRSSRRDGHGEGFAEVLLANGRRLRICPAIDEASLVRLIRVVETA